MKLNRTSTRSPEEIATAFGDLVDEGRALLAQVLDKPAKTAQTASSTLQDTLDEVSQKLADFQTSATRAAQYGAKQGARYAREADRYLHDNPWPVVAGGIVLGALATLWFTQRR
jgi:ElaB/YqjD/DUF883 family membrane-anchored ribosome-binding protein